MDFGGSNFSVASDAASVAVNAALDANPELKTVYEVGSAAFEALNSLCYSHKIANGQCTSTLAASGEGWTPGPCCYSVTGDNADCMKMAGWEKPTDSNGETYCKCAKRSWYGKCEAYEPGKKSWWEI
mmetsp:Transcript_119142/g.207379  ORF Transcript_119142/g.207379 Transcript_119142/m.207379 type:complete len:127 (-) Transcript_119142:338-718(-)